MTSHKKMITYLWSFSFGFFTIHNIWSFWINTSHFEIDAWNFWYKSLSLFPSRILVCATAFATHYLFSFWDLHLLSSLSNKNKKCGKIYRHKSTHVSKLTWLLTNHSLQAWRSIYNNHTKMSRFFPQRYKCKNNKLSLWMHKAICTNSHVICAQIFTIKFFEFFTFYVVLDFLLTQNWNIKVR